MLPETPEGGLAETEPPLELQPNTFTTFVIGPHLFASDIQQQDWVFSSPIDYWGEEHGVPDPWVVSTHQVGAWLGHSAALRARVTAIDIVYCVLGNGVGVIFYTHSVKSNFE